MKRITSPTVIESAACGKQISAFGSAARFDESSLFQAGENQLQKLLRNPLAARDVGDLDRLARALERQVEHGVQGVFTFDGDVHLERTAESIPIETRD